MAPKNDDCSLFNNNAGSSPCDWDPDDVCRGSTEEQCTCSGISYLVWAACDACTPPPLNTTWNDYAHKVFTCTGLPQQYPLPFPTGRDAFASWALAMAVATPTPTIFDLAAASAFLESTSIPPTTQDTSSTSIPVTTSSAPPTSQDITTTPRSSNTSTSLATTAPSSSPRHVTTEPQSATGSQSTTATSSPSLAVSVGSRSTVIPMSTTSNLPLISTQRNPLPTGAIIGIAVGIGAMISLAILFVWLRRRRQQASYSTTPFPITSHDADTSVSSSVSARDPPSVSAARLHHLQTDSGAGQEKMSGNEISDSPTSFGSTTYFPGRNMSTFAALGAFTRDPGAPGPDVMSQLWEMTARVRELEAQLESPPPGYSGEEP